MAKSNVYLKTFGCQMNEHDSERIMGILSKMGYSETENPENADLALLNTCSIREKADQKAYSDLGRMEKVKQKNPSLIIGVAGCMAKQEGSRIFHRSPGVDLIFNSKNIWRLPLLLEAVQKRKEKIAALEDTPYLKPYPSQRQGKIKAWVSIMEGCDKSCTYCVVPYTRGKEISRPLGEIINEVEELSKSGFKEITLLGQNVNAYGKNSETDGDFPDLLKRLNDVEGIERIRFITSHPWDLSDKLIHAMASLSKICEHLHLPLQSGSNPILERMRRAYTYSEYIQKITKLRTALPKISLTTDIIVGFPGEKEKDFQRTLNGLKEIQFDGVFCFQYSHRPNTPALGFPDQIPLELKKQRLQEVLTLQRAITEKIHQGYLDRNQEVLVEGPSKMNSERLSGRTRTNKVVNFKGDENLYGKLVNVQITQVKSYSFDGELRETN
jgi:tRNA-2-methylthio-N6-dimethylallyladenosine synthase